MAAGTAEPIDLTDQLPPPGPLPKQSQSELITVRQENTRRLITYILLLYLGAIVAVALVALYAEGIALDRTKDILTILVGPIIGLVGTVVGFYFGAQTVKEEAAGLP
jgi:hypothetical protein